jgi:hypothetical protein
MHWFGRYFGAPYQRDTEQAETPTGAPCAWCAEPIAASDDGVTLPMFGEPGERAYHYDCHLRGIVGGVNHQRGLCICCGGTEPPDPPELTRRQAAQRAVMEWDFSRGAGYIRVE